MKFAMPAIPKVFSQNNLMLLAAAVLLAVLLGVAVRQFLVSREGFEDQVTVTFYKMAGCPHCIDFEPEWTKFTAMAKSAGINTPEPVDSKDPSKPASIVSFPTITIQKGSGPYTEYKGDRTADALLAACKAA